MAEPHEHSEPPATRTYSRRRLLELAALGGIGLAVSAPVAACAPAAQPPAPTAAPPAPKPAQPAAPAPTAPAAGPAPTAAIIPTAAPVAKPTVRGPLVKITRTLNSNITPPSFADFWGGKYLGYYEEEGIDPEYQGSQGAAQNIQLLMTGKTTFSEGVQDGLFGLAAKGEKPAAKLIFNSTRGLIYQVGVNPDSPVKDHKDLKAKKVGVMTLAHPGVNYLRTVLKDAGLNMDKDVEVLAVGSGAQAGTALQRGDIAGVVLWDQEFVSLENAGFKTRLIPQPAVAKLITGGNSTGVSLDFLKNNRKAVVGSMRAWAKTIVFRLTNPAALVQIHWKMYPETRPKDKPEAVALKEEVASLEVRNPKMDPKTFGLTKFGEFDPKGWELYADFIGLGGQIKVADWYTNELIDEINDFDRKKIEEQARSFKI